MVGFKRFTGVFFFIVVVFSAVVYAQGGGVHSVVLDNGMKAGFHAVGSSHYVIQVRVGAGFVDELKGETGGYHWLEHGMFRGTEKFPTKELFEKALQRLGIQYNASTTYERTAYYFVVPAEHIVEAIEIFADMIANPILDPKEMKDELEPVKEEAWRDAKNNPAFDLFMAQLALHSKTPRLQKYMTGTPAEMDEQPGELPRRLYERSYSAHNMTAALVGPEADNPELQEIFVKALGRIKKHSIPARGSFSDELKPSSKLTMYKVKTEAGNPRYLSIAWDIADTIGNEITARAFATWFNRPDSPLSMLKSNGIISESGVSTDTFRSDKPGFIRVSIILKLTEKGEQMLPLIHQMGSVVFGSILNKGVPEHIIAEMKAALNANGQTAEDFSEQSAPTDAESILGLPRSWPSTTLIGDNVVGENSKFKRRYGRYEKVLNPNAAYHSTQFRLMGTADFITDILVSPDPDREVQRRNEAFQNLGQEQFRWLMAQMPPQNAQLTYRAEAASGPVHPEVQREVEAVDLTWMLPDLKKAFELADLEFDSPPNEFLYGQQRMEIAQNVKVVGRKKKTVPTYGIDMLHVPRPEGAPAEAKIEFRFPKGAMSPLELVAVEVALRTFLADSATEVFLHNISEAGVSISTSIDKSEMKLFISADGPSKPTAKALERYIAMLRGYRPNENALGLAKIQVIDETREIPIGEVAHQAVSAGIKKFQGGQYIDSAKKLQLIEQVDLKLVEKLLGFAQKTWATRAVLMTSWEPLTVQNLASMMVAPKGKQLFVRYPKHKAELPEHGPKESMEITLSGVDRQGVARLYHVPVGEFSTDRFILEIAAQAMSDLAMDIVRTQLKYAYATGAGFSIVKQGGVLYLEADTSKNAEDVLKGLDMVVESFLSHGPSEDSFENFKHRMLENIKDVLGSVDGQFALRFKNLSKIKETYAELSSMSREQFNLRLRQLLRTARKLDSVVVGPNDPICQRLLSSGDSVSHMVPNGGSGLSGG